MINCTFLKNYLYENIPLSLALGVEVVQAEKAKVILKAPLAPNVNHQKTVFGGSLHALATLASWSLVFLNLQEKKIDSEIVIASSKIKYMRPVTEDFEAVSFLEQEGNWKRFEEMLKRFKKAKISLKAHIFQDGKLAVDYEGEFAAIAQRFPLSFNL